MAIKKACLNTQAGKGSSHECEASVISCVSSPDAGTCLTPAPAPTQERATQGAGLELVHHAQSDRSLVFTGLAGVEGVGIVAAAEEVSTLIGLLQLTDTGIDLGALAELVIQSQRPGPAAVVDIGVLGLYELHLGGVVAEVVGAECTTRQAINILKAAAGIGVVA